MCLIIIIGMNVAPLSAANVTVDSGLKNSDIQKIIDNSKSGDTLNFKGNSYSNISLIINKKLNILSTKNTILNGNNSNGNGSIGSLDSFVFYFTKQSSGSVLSGFNILANSDYGIIAENVQNLNIKHNQISDGSNGLIKLENAFNTSINGNTLSHSNGNGILVDKSNKITLNNNQINNNTLSGIKITDSSELTLNYNRVIDNNLSGLSIYSSKRVSVKNNSLENNGHGIYLANTNGLNISGNNIVRNKLNGISMEEMTQNTFISLNTISYNLNGIFLDSYSINDTIIANIIGNSFQSIYTDLDVFDTGNGIIVGNNYQKSSSNINIRYNVITRNQQFSIKSNPQYDNFVVGSNWFGNNNAYDTGTCPMVSSCILTAKLEKTSGGYALRFYETTGSKTTAVSYMPVINVMFQLNGANTQIVPVINGTAIYNNMMDNTKENVLTVLFDNYVQNYLISPTPPVNGNNSTNNNDDTDSDNNTGTINSTSNNTGSNGNSTGSGNGNGSGVATNGTLTGSGYDTTQIGVTGSSSNEGGQESKGDESGGYKATEVSIKNAMNSVKENPLTNLGIIALLGLIAVGYFKRDKFM